MVIFTFFVTFLHMGAYNGLWDFWQGLKYTFFVIGLLTICLVAPYLEEKFNEQLMNLMSN